MHIMCDVERQIIRDAVAQANSFHELRPINCEIVGESIEGLQINIDHNMAGGQWRSTGTIRCLQTLSFEEIDHEILAVRLDDKRDEEKPISPSNPPWRIIEARGDSLFAVLYA